MPAIERSTVCRRGGRHVGDNARAGCPVSRVLNATITMSAALEG